MARKLYVSIGEGDSRSPGVPLRISLAINPESLHTNG